MIPLILINHKEVPSLSIPAYLAALVVGDSNQNSPCGGSELWYANARSVVLGFGPVSLSYHDAHN